MSRRARRRRLRPTFATKRRSSPRQPVGLPRASGDRPDKEALKRIDAARTTYMRALNDKVLEMEKAGDKASL